MAIKVGGLSQKEFGKHLNIHRSTLHRFRKDPNWPGDDAPFGILQAWVTARRGSAGRKPNKREIPADPEDPTMKPDPDEQPDPESFDEAWHLNNEFKRSQIEKNYAQAGKFNLYHCEYYRKELTAKLNRAFDRFFDELEHCNLEREQLANIRNAMRRCQEEIAGADETEIQPELLAE